MKFFFFLGLTLVFVLGPIELRVYLMRKISKFRTSREVGGLNFGFWPKKIFLKGDSIQIYLIYCNVNRHRNFVDDAKSLLSAVSDASTRVNLSSYIVNGFCRKYAN